jgi:pectinesterase
MKKIVLLLILFFLSSTSFLMSQTSNPEKYKYNFVVAKDGRGDFKYIQGQSFF